MPKTREQCEEIRENTKTKIVHGALICFAQNGYSGTKISQLAKQIGIGQGTLYNYFSSKEELFKEIITMLNSQNEIGFQNLRKANLDAKAKIELISKSMVNEINKKSITAYSFVLNLKMVEEESIENIFTKSYETIPMKMLSEIIIQGQKDETVVEGDAYKLADFYWNVVHTLALMSINSKNNSDKERYQVEVSWLNRILLRD